MYANEHDEQPEIPSYDKWKGPSGAHKRRAAREALGLEGCGSSTKSAARKLRDAVAAQSSKEVPPEDQKRHIRVFNIPRDLTEADVKEVFEEACGSVVTCKVSMGVACLAFAQTEAARAAVSTFDRGKLNDNYIYVVLGDAEASGCLGN